MVNKVIAMGSSNQLGHADASSSQLPMFVDGSTISVLEWDALMTRWVEGIQDYAGEWRRTNDAELPPKRSGTHRAISPEKRRKARRHANKARLITRHA